MANFPSKWFDFTTIKEIKRIRKDINSTLSLKIEIATSIILTIIAFCFSEYIHNLDTLWQVLICILTCLFVLFIFFTPNIIKMISSKKHGNIIVKGKNAIATFDDDIVYNVLVAAEYFNSIEQIKSNSIRKDLIAFYYIEIEYYLSKAIGELLQFNANYTEIFGNQKSQISLARLKNVLDLIDSIRSCSGIKLDNTYEKAIECLYEYSFE